MLLHNSILEFNRCDFNKDSRLAIFVASPDCYSDVFHVFLECYNKFWNDSPYELILSTNNGQYEGITVYNNYAESDGWVDRALPVIKRIENEYILIMCDDSLISKKVDTDKVKMVLDDMVQYHLDFIGMSNFIKGKKLHKDSLIDIVKKNKAYALNLNCGIYRREFLIELLGDGNSNAWKLEEKWLKEAGKAKSEYFQNVGSCNTDLFGCKNAVLKGHWFQTVIDDMGKSGIVIKTSRGIIPRNTCWKIHIISKIGKTIPAFMRSWIKKVVTITGYKFATGS